MSMYSSARFSSHKRVRAVFIGRRLMIMTALFVVLSVVTFSLGAVAAKRLKTADAAFNKFMISEAIPIVAAAKAKTNGGICAAVKNIFLLTHSIILRFFPCFAIFHGSESINRAQKLTSRQMRTIRFKPPRTMLPARCATAPIRQKDLR